MSGRWTRQIVVTVALASMVGVVVRYSNKQRPHGHSVASSQFRRGTQAVVEEEAAGPATPPVVTAGDPQAPQLAWLMSFPDSGTTFSSMTIQSVSQRGTASNYGNMFMHPNGEVVRDLYASIPVYSDRPNGPYLFSNLALPSRFILTKTHCGGHCTDCFPGRYMFGPNQFVQQCHTSSRFHPAKLREDPTAYPFEHPQYDPNMVKKAVHLIRNPFDNVVSRFHHEYKLAVVREDNDFTSNYSYNSNGFHKWCAFQADKFREEETKWYTEWTNHPDIMDKVRNVPCHAEFFKYLQWHNNAFYTTDDKLRIPTLVLHYEQWAHDFDGTLDRVLTFYDLPMEGEPMEFHFHTYNYYSDEEKEATIAFMKLLASPTLWENLAPYVQTSEDNQGENDAS